MTSLNMAGEAALRAERALTQDGPGVGTGTVVPRVKMAAPAAGPGPGLARTQDVGCEGWRPRGGVGMVGDP